MLKQYEKDLTLMVFLCGVQIFLGVGSSLILDRGRAILFLMTYHKLSLFFASILGGFAGLVGAIEQRKLFKHLENPRSNNIPFPTGRKGIIQFAITVYVLETVWFLIEYIAQSSSPIILRDHVHFMVYSGGFMIVFFGIMLGSLVFFNRP